MGTCQDRRGPSSSSSTARTCTPGSRTSLPADNRPAFCFRSPSASASPSSPASPSVPVAHQFDSSRQCLLRTSSTADDQVISIVHDVRLPTLLVPKFPPPQHESSHVQITEQGTDRRSLRRPSTFVPIARTSTFISTLVGFFDWGFQPHLDQMQHGSVDDPASDRLHQLGMWNTIEGTYDTLPIISTFPKRSPLSDFSIRSKVNH